MTDRLAWAVGELAALSTTDFEIDEMLGLLCDVAAGALEVDGVGVMRVVDGQNRFVRATRDHGVDDLERLQDQLQQGPCKEAVVTGLPFFVASPVDMAWPAFEVEADRSGLRAVYAVPLISRGRVWGCLDLYWRRPHRLTAAERSQARLLADVAVSYLVMASDRAQALAAQQRLAKRVLHDELTGLPNRGLIQELIHHALASAERRSTLVALLFVDLDSFKSVNDVYGHQVGDLVLELVASRLRAVIGGSDVVGRLSGDEFLVLRDVVEPTECHLEDLMALGHQVCSAIAAPISADERMLTISASVGIALASGRIAAAQLLHEADSAMYTAKAQGRNRVVLRRADHQPSDRRHLERRLFEVVERQELRLHFQPIVSAVAGPRGSEQVVGVEALVRWQHPDLGLLAAADFIDLAESSGAIVPVGHWVIQQATAQLRRWDDELGDRAPTVMFCNLSPRQLVSPDLVPAIDDALAAVDLPPHRLGLEILEHNLEDPRLVPVLDRLQLVGHPLAVDDFGTGYSSLHRLVELPISHVKLDRSLVHRLPDDLKSRTLIRAILTVAGSLGVKVICEGVENADQADHLRSAGADLLQGYHFGRPADGTTVGRRLLVPVGSVPPDGDPGAGSPP